MKRVIFHVDVNSAFLSWEACYRLHHLGGKQDLREIVSAVGGDQEKRHGIILAKSIPAKKYHIQTGETVVSAKQKCPELVLVPPNYDLYNRSSKALIRMLGDYTDKIEQYSIDEAFLDMTGCCFDPEEKAHEMRSRIRNELGFTVNFGISENKLLANRIASIPYGGMRFQRKCGRFRSEICSMLVTLRLRNCLILESVQSVNWQQ